MSDPICIICKGVNYNNRGLCHYLCCIGKQKQPLEKCVNECAAYYHKECILTEIYKKEKLRISLKNSELLLTNSNDSYECLNCFKHSGFELPQSKLDELTHLENNMTRCQIFKQHIYKYIYFHMYLLYIIFSMIFDIYWMFSVKKTEFLLGYMLFGIVLCCLQFYCIIGPIVKEIAPSSLYPKISFIYLCIGKICISVWTTLEYYNITNILNKDNIDEFEQTIIYINDFVTVHLIITIITVFSTILVLGTACIILSSPMGLYYCIIGYRNKLKNNINIKDINSSDKDYLLEKGKTNYETV